MEIHSTSVYDKEMSEFLKKYCHNRTSLEELLAKHGKLISQHLKNPGLNMLNANDFNRVADFGEYDVYFFKAIIPGANLKRTQHPKAYILAYDNKLWFLCCGTHLKNYKDAELRQKAKEAVKDIIDPFGP